MSTQHQVDSRVPAGFRHGTVYTFPIAPDGNFPNNPQLPLVLVEHVLANPAQSDPSLYEEAFARNGWGGTWQDGVYEFHHYHSEAHEVLGCCAGQARIQFGGPNGPIQPLKAGDMVIIPAGVAHRCVEKSRDFLVVGAYPPEQRPDMCYGEPAELQNAARQVAAVPIPGKDPVFGEAGPLMECWR